MFRDKQKLIIMLKDTNLLQKGNVSHNYLQKKIERVISLVESIDLINPISAKLLLVASCIEVTALYDELINYNSFLIKYCIPRKEGEPSFVELGQNLENAANKFFRSDLAFCYMTYDRLSVEGWSEKQNKEIESKVRIVELSFKKAHDVFNKVKSEYDERKLHYFGNMDFSKIEEFSEKGIADLIDLLSYLCGCCNLKCSDLNEIVKNPSIYSLKNGLELYAKLYLKNEFPSKIKQFNIDRKLALDEFDENSSERATEEIKYLQVKRKEIQSCCNKDFFSIWIENNSPIKNRVDFEAVINKLLIEKNMPVEDIMNKKLLESNLNEVYLYEYITSEIKRLRVIQKQNDKVIVNHELTNVQLYKNGDHLENKSLNQEPEKLDLNIFKKYSLFVRDKVIKVIEKFYFDSPANLALIEIAFYDHDLLKKKNQHLGFLKDLIKMDAIKISDEDISKTANGMSVKKKNLPNNGYISWPDSLQNDKKTCMDIAEILGPTIKYKGLS